MTRRRRLILSAAAIAGLVAVVLVVLGMLPPRPGVTKANFDRIEKGMTLHEVEAILGECHMMEPPNRTKNQGGLGLWFGADDSEAIIVSLNGDNVSTGKEFRESTETIREKIRRWLRLPN